MPCVPDKGCMVGGDAMRDAQAGVPSAGWLGRNLRSKTRCVHGILQFTKYRILLRSSSMREPRYPLPRVVCDSKEATTNTHTANGTKWNASFSFVVFPWHIPCRGLLWCRIKIHGTPNGATTNISRRGASDRAKAHTPDSRL
ncbi:hypothetical protein L1887_63581 [Cichorium endivia]|nr:hypothetical protein L1887_63581 [Cichorium endivia]